MATMNIVPTNIAQLKLSGKSLLGLGIPPLKSTLCWSRRTEYITIEGQGEFEGYANRDSLSYVEVYGLHDVKTLYRGTLRKPGFSRSWDVFVQLGMTDDSYVMEGSETMTNRDFVNSFLPFSLRDNVELKLRAMLKLDQDDRLMQKLQWLGIFDKVVIGLKNATPAQMLQHILEQKWSMPDTPPS